MNTPNPHITVQETPDGFAIHVHGAIGRQAMELIAGEAKYGIDKHDDTRREAFSYVADENPSWTQEEFEAKYEEFCMAYEAITERTQW